MTDASGEGLGGVLCQADKNGNCRPIHYVSRRCSEAERRYSPTELEALAIKFACDKLEQYIQFIPVKVLTDHQPLVGIFRKQGTSNKRITRFIAEMIPHFQLDVQYLAGKSNVMADALSRALPKKEKEPKEAQVTALAVTISKGQWKEQLRMDSEYGRIIALIEGNDPAKTAEEAKEALSYAESFSTDENHLYCVMKDGARRKVVPAEVRNEILIEFHEGTTGVHASAAKLYEIISREFFWKNLRSSCESFCQRCTTCTLNRVGRNQRPPLDAIRSTAAMEMLCVDVLKLGPSRAGNLYAVVMIDQFSKYLVASAVPDKSATSVMQAITTDWIARFGAPSCIHSDNGSEFCNSTMTALCESLGITHSTASVYHPMGNGVTERVNRDIISMLRKTVPSQFDWDQRLPFVLLAHNVMVHRATKFSPYEIIFGKKPRLPILDEGDRFPDSRYTVDIDAYHLLLTENLEWVKKQAQPNLSKAAGEYEQYYDARVRARPHHFNIGDSVVIRKMPKSKVSREKHRKLEFLNEGPFKVTSARKTSVEIERNDGKREWIRAERVLPYVASADIASINVSFQNKHKIGLTMITAEELDYDEEPIQPETIPMEVKESEGEVQSATERQSPTHKWEIESNIDCHISVIRSGDVDEGIPAKILLTERIARKPPTPQRVKKDDRIRRVPMKGTLLSRLSTSNRRPDQRRVLASPKEQSVDETIEVVAGIPREDLRHDYVIIGDQLAEVIGRRCDNECHSVHSCKELADWSNGEDSEATHVLVAISRLFPLRHGEENYTMALRHLIRSQRDRDPARQVLVLAPPPLRNIALYHDRWLNTLQLCCEGESNASLVCNEGFHSVITSFFYGAEANRELIAENGSLTVKGKKVLELTLKELVKMPLRWKDA